MTQEEAARSLGIADLTVARWATDLGLTIERSGHRLEYTPEMVAAIRVALEQSRTRVCRQCQTSFVSQWRRQFCSVVCERLNSRERSRATIKRPVMRAEGAWFLVWVKRQKPKRVARLLAKLPSREAEMLRLRFVERWKRRCEKCGGWEERPYTLESVAIKFNLSRERIRQITHGALRRVRALITQETGPSSISR